MKKFVAHVHMDVVLQKVVAMNMSLLNLLRQLQHCPQTKFSGTCSALDVVMQSNM